MLRQDNLLVKIVDYKENGMLKWSWNRGEIMAKQVIVTADKIKKRKKH